MPVLSVHASPERTDVLTKKAPLDASILGLWFTPRVPGIVHFGRL